MIVLVVVADSLKGEAPGFAGGGAATPFLDGLAAEGAVFDNYCASGAWTIPSVMSMLTGTWPHRLGLCRWRHPFPAHRATLLTAFAAAGFETRCFHPYPQWGFLTLPGKTRVENSQDVAAVESALRAPRGHDRFVFLLHWWTHLPYVNRELARGAWHAACDLSLDSLAKYPGRFAAMLERRYFDAVSYFSEQVLPRYVNAAASGGDDVLVAVTGDHGETWGRSLPSGRNVELIYDLHGRWITDETIRVPLVLHGRGADGAIPARRIDGMAAGVDFAPTVADLAGIPWPGPAPAETGSGVAERLFAPEDDAGVSLAACVREGAVTPRREVMTVSSHNTHEPKTYPESGRNMWRTFALRDDTAWYIWDGVARERTVTPHAGQPAPDEERADAVFSRLEAHRQNAVDSAPPVGEDTAETLRGDAPAATRGLRSLGYLD